MWDGLEPATLTHLVMLKRILLIDNEGVEEGHRDENEEADEVCGSS